MYFLLDLDGTLVITDFIYFNVWKELLFEYNIILTEEIFKNFIQGNNDLFVKNSLLSEININVKELSIKKDELFIKNINKIKVIDGLYVFLKNILLYGHKCCIVTNCNKIVAQTIIDYIKINEYISFIISNDDCIYSKPNPEPYVNAINKFNTTNGNCIIIEDSKSGLLSAKSVNPKLLIGIETIYTKEELFNYGVNKTIENYINFNFDFNYLVFPTNENNLIKDINKCFNGNEIIINQTKLKGGNIADIISFQVIDNISNMEYILKYESNEENNLSNIAKKIKLYEREYYFYKEISNHINIHIPKFIGLIQNNNKPYGLIIEKISNNYIINKNLNNDIDLSLKIINNICKVHCKFWNKDIKKIFPGLYKNNDDIFNPFMKDYIQIHITNFLKKWGFLLKNTEIITNIYNDFENIQNRLSTNNLTFIHGDLKSPNIFYNINENNEPCIIDWQHCCIGKGVQDLIFFIIESFDINTIKRIYPLFKSYYYNKIIESNIDYSYQQYEIDIYDAICYIPFFTSIWFGTVPNDELIDKNFPYFFISKFILLLNIYA
jgi:beta-phosphoglucomutase